jgi:hypothetical protein
MFGPIVRSFLSCSFRNMYSFPSTKCWIKPGSRFIPNYCKSYRKKLHERMCTLSTYLRVMHYLALCDYQCYSLGVGLLQIREWGVHGKVFNKTVWKKVKLALSTTWRRRLNRGIAPLILNLDTRWRSGVIFTLRPLYPREERNPDTHWTGGWMGLQQWNIWQRLAHNFLLCVVQEPKSGLDRLFFEFYKSHIIGRKR